MYYSNLSYLENTCTKQDQFHFFSPDVKVSEEQSDKSGTDPEDSEENFNQADITDYRNYEQIFRPRQRELNRTPEITDEEFQAPEISEPETSLPTVPPPPVQAVQRPAHLKVHSNCIEI